MIDIGFVRCSRYLYLNFYLWQISAIVWWVELTFNIWCCCWCGCGCGCSWCWWRWCFWLRSFCYRQATFSLMSILQTETKMFKMIEMRLNGWIDGNEKLTSKWLFACSDHSSRVANIRPQSSHDHDNGWFVGWFGIDPIFVCGLFDCWLCILPCNRLFGVDSWCICECMRFCLFSLFPVFFLISVSNG